MRTRYPGVEDLFRRTTFLRETHPYPSLLQNCLSKVVSNLSQRTPGWLEGDDPGGAGPRGVLIWCQQVFPAGPTGTSRMA